MTDNKKEQQRAELHRTIWNIANDLRGSVDGWDFKQYVLGFLFYRYISENFTNHLNKNEHNSGYDKSFDYAKLTDKDVKQIPEEEIKSIINRKGFFILPSQLFCNVRKIAKNDEKLNETLEKTFRAIEQSSKGTASENNFKGLFDDLDVNSSKLGATVIERNKKLVKIIDNIGDMNLGDYQSNEIDAFGDAYEFLMAVVAGIGRKYDK